MTLTLPWAFLIVLFFSYPDLVLKCQSKQALGHISHLSGSNNSEAMSHQAYGIAPGASTIIMPESKICIYRKINFNSTVSTRLTFNVVNTNYMSK